MRSGSGMFYSARVCEGVISPGLVGASLKIFLFADTFREAAQATGPVCAGMVTQFSTVGTVLLRACFETSSKQLKALI